MKRVLITGANSYIGTSFEAYAGEHYPDDLSIETIDMIDGTWREKDFSKYDIVFHVAGIAHADVGRVDEATKKKYYEVNTTLAIETAKKAKSEGVGQFVFMSSSIIYGDSAPYGKRKVITRDTKPHPSNFYGDSKWRADKGVRALARDVSKLNDASSDRSDSLSSDRLMSDGSGGSEGLKSDGSLGSGRFIVTVLRPPMIYGKGSKGNYPTLAKLAKKLPIFPDVKNERSMLYIENLCEFLCQVMIRGEGGVFWPQNAEYSRTSEMVRMIADVSGHNIKISRIWNWTVGLARLIPGKPRRLADKAFGNLVYDKGMSEYGFRYQKVGLRKSIKRTEGR